VSTSAWEFVFMMLVLKLPILYLIGVVWWAVRATPDPYEPAALIPAQLDPAPTRPPLVCPWRAGLRPGTTRAARSRVATAGGRR
jgi:hypothetical protein